MSGDEERGKQAIRGNDDPSSMEEWKAYKQQKRSRLKNTDFSIISLNCCGTIIYRDMEMPYLSPTNNLSMSVSDYMKLAENLRWYMAQELTEVEADAPYPVGMLGDIKIYFVHYKTFEDAKEKWERRRERINWDNLFFMTMEKAGNTRELMERFEQLPCRNKVIFTNREYPEFSAAFYIKGFEGQDGLGDITAFRSRSPIRRYEDDFDYVAFLNGEGNCKEPWSGFVKDRVTVITPVYNGESHLAFMLDSVLGQTYPHIEMTLIDDGSTDRTVEVAESYREKFRAKGYGYRIIRGFHKNASAAVNGGLPYVTGEFLIWPDSDDVLEPESVEKRAAFLKAHPTYGAVRSQSYYFDRDKGVLDKSDEKTGDLDREELFWDILEFKTYVCCGCYMVRSEEFFKIYPERCIPEYPVGQNFQMLLPFMYRHRCFTIREPLYGVCVREGSHSRTPLGREEEEQKYRDYESLVDEIADICGIRDRASKRRILCWKVKRRYEIAWKYGERKQMAKALFHLCLCGRSGLKLFGERVRILWKHNRIAGVKTWLYWRFRIGTAKVLGECIRGWKKTAGWCVRKGGWVYWRVRIWRANRRRKGKKESEDN